MTKCDTRKSGSGSKRAHPKNQASSIGRTPNPSPEAVGYSGGLGTSPPLAVVMS